MAQSYPELEKRHLLNVFFSSGITFENVRTLRELLGLTYKEYSDLRSPPLHAMETVMEWQNKEPLPLEKTHKVLAEKLAIINLNASIPLLQGRERHTAVEPKVMIEFLAEQCKTFSRKQAHTFGAKLQEFYKVNIDDIRTNRGMDLVIQIFRYINQGNENLKEDLIDKIIEAVNEAAAYSEEQPAPSHSKSGLSLHVNEQPSLLPRSVSSPIQVNKQPTSPQASVGLTSANEQAAGTVEADYGHHDMLPPPSYPNIIAGQENERETQPAVDPPDEEENNISIPPTQQDNIKKKCCVKFLAVILPIVIVVFAVCLVAAVCLLFSPSFPHVVPIQTIIPNDVVLFKIPLSYWLTHISIDLQGPFITGCHAEVISIKCKDVVQNTYTSIRYGNHLNYLYIEKEGMITFTLSNSSDEYCSPYYAWTFTTIQSAISNVSNNFKNLACGNPLENVHCADLSEIETFVAPESSYYYIRCNNRDDNCTQVDISINSSRYDFESSKRFQIDSVSIHTQRTEESIKVRPDFNLDDPICLLMELSSECRDANPSIYQVAILKMTRRLDFSLFYPSISFLIVVSIITSIIICIILAKWLYRRSNNADQQEHCDDSEHASLTNNEEMELPNYTPPPPNDDSTSESSATQV